MSSPEYELAIVGSGGAAFSAAIAARERDLRVVMIERTTVGGTCVNVGCIPSKALLAAAEQRHRAGVQRFPGIRSDAGPVDMAALEAGKDEIVGALRREKYLELADRHAIELVHGDAHCVDGPALDVDGRTIVAAAYLVATGSTPRIPDIPGLADSRLLTSTTAMNLDALPASLIVLGGGYVALEQAQLFAHLGTTATTVARSSIARREEPEIAEALRDALVADGIRVLEQTDVQSVRRDGTQITVLTGTGELSAEHLLVATGRRPQGDGLGLNAAGVLTDKDGAVVVDAELRTSNSEVWAAGDVTGHPQFVYVAARHGKIMVENAFDAAARNVDYTALPRITFTNPTIASAGLTEAEARAKGLATDSRVLELSAAPRSIVSRAVTDVWGMSERHDGGDDARAVSTASERTQSMGGTAADARDIPPAREHACARVRLHAWIGDDFSAWAYANRRGGVWSVSVPAFSITAEDASAEGAFEQANALLIAHLIVRLDRDPVRLRTLRTRPRRTRLGFVLKSLVAEAIGTARRRPPSVQRVLLTSRSLDLLARRSGAALTQRLEAIRNAERRPTPIVEEKPRPPARRRLLFPHRPRRPGSPVRSTYRPLRGGSST